MSQKLSVGIQVHRGKTQIVVNFPVLEVDSPEEAEALLLFTCSKNQDGQHIAHEVELSKTEALLAFARRLADAYAVTKRKRRKKK